MLEDFSKTLKKKKKRDKYHNALNLVHDYTKQSYTQKMFSRYTDNIPILDRY